MVTRSKAAAAMLRLHHTAKQYVMRVNLDSLKSKNPYVARKLADCVTDNWLRVDVKSDRISRSLSDALRSYVENCIVTNK